MLWRMGGGTERTCWEVNSSALTCEELHYTSITSLTHSFFPAGAASKHWAVTVSLLQTELQSWFNHHLVQIHIAVLPLAFSKSLHSRCNAGWWHFSQYASPLFDLKTCDHLSNTMLHWVEDLLKAHLHHCEVDLYDLLPTSKWLQSRADWIPLHNSPVCCWEN